MDTIFMNSENSKTYDPNKVLLNLKYGVLKKSYRYIGLSNLSMYYTWKKYRKSYTKTINLKCQL